MARVINESDWRLFRKLEPIALDRRAGETISRCMVHFEGCPFPHIAVRNRTAKTSFARKDRVRGGRPCAFRVCSRSAPAFNILTYAVVGTSVAYDLFNRTISSRARTERTWAHRITCSLAEVHDR